MADDDEQPTQVLSGPPQPPGGGTAVLEPHEPRLAEGGGGGSRPPYPPTGYGGDGNGDDWGEGDPGDRDDRRVAILGAVVGILLVIVLFLLLRPSNDDELLPAATSGEPAVVQTDAPAAATATAEPDATATDVPDPTATPAATDAPSGGAAVDGAGDVPTLGAQGSGVKKFAVSQGETAEFRVANDSDQPQEVHVHGYDKAFDVDAGEAKTISFTADITGIFEIEFEGSGTQIGELTVEP